MDILVRFGFTIEEIQNIINLPDEHISSMINLLEKNKCNKENIKNILICNPFFITKNLVDSKTLIKALKDFGFSNLNLLFDSNPYILNLNSTKLKKLLDELINKNLTKKEIIDYINYNIIF